ncbi:DUF3068 domain-containing protein [Nocardioides daeguensis]|uniref:DUF3068 domain-containing protein n=1 Tax=Nocardioides daeguensis TaxID=908359 RepID=A0ABP6UVE2_9ACTN|nr:DUF3068 domain-containing protein [Nocardioides daeguensis]MBV6725625.1 DUF3068 domain-containing protein [Nocardioides daeguensis]MCR1772860.1 DUF3068 domain-containing protein [Nocardioides daeguensis]
MRSKLAAVSVGLGVFLIVAAALVRFYAYPVLANVPPDYEGTTKLQAKDAQIFNSKPEVLAPETWDLDITSVTIADSGVEAPGDTVVWVNSTTVNRVGGEIFQQTRERAPFDGKTGAAVDCAKCGSWEEVARADDFTKIERVDVKRKGLIYKFPFGTEKKDYPLWDGTLGKAVDAKFEGEEKIDGLSVYKFVQTIPDTMVETREVPGSVFGSTEAGNVTAEMWYQMTRTFYVEPETGSPVNRVENRVQELRYDGVSVPAFTGTVQYTKAQVDDLVSDAKSNSTLLGGMKLLFPVLLLLLGAGLVAAGLVLGRAARRERAGHRRDEALIDA